jgi:hypothetical protein
MPLLPAAALALFAPPDVPLPTHTLALLLRRLFTTRSIAAAQGLLHKLHLPSCSALPARNLRAHPALPSFAQPPHAAKLPLALISSHACLRTPLDPMPLLPAVALALFAPPDMPLPTHTLALLLRRLFTTRSIAAVQGLLHKLLDIG